MKQSEIVEILEEIAGEDFKITKVEFLGNAVVVYVNDVNPVYEKGGFINKAASTLKKKILLRTDRAYLMPEEEAEKVIREIIPQEAGITEILFNKELSEVWIEAEKPGLVIGKEGSRLKEIITKTGWAPKVLRRPTIHSETLKNMRKFDFKNFKKKKKFLERVGRQIYAEVKPSPYARIIALGGFGEVGRSCTLIETENSRILIDVGVSPSQPYGKNAFPMLDKIGCTLSDLDAVIITHAHTDHMAFLPYLFRMGFEGPVYLTEPTRDLMALLQTDYINVVKKYYGVEPPYEKEDINKELQNTITVTYGEVIDVTPEIKVSFWNAGHILGSAMVHVNINEGKGSLLHSGDFNFGPTQLFNPAHTQFPPIKTVLMESTYGLRSAVNPPRKEAEEKLIKEILETLEKNKGKVLIPVFAVGRSQEIMLAIEKYARNNEDWNYPIYIDGMVREATAIHTAYPDYLKSSLRKRILSNDSPFEFEFFKVVQKGKREEIADGEPSVILAPSGMLTGGPSVEFLKLLAGDKRNKIIFVGYQASMSLGAKIQQGMREVPVPEEGEMKMLRIEMDVTTAEGFSGHSDRKQLMAWVHNLNPKPKEIYTMHGELRASTELSKDISNYLHVKSEPLLNLEAIRIY